jgi:DNA-binding transcriptional LysR family regulator
MSLTQAGHRLLADSRAMLALAEEADQRLHDDQAALRGHLRLFATIDFGQSTVTRLISSFVQINQDVTAELRYTNRPARMIEELIWLSRRYLARAPLELASRPRLGLVARNLPLPAML